MDSPSTADSSKRVVVFRSAILPPSETFIRDQIGSLSAWDPLLLGYEEFPGGLETPGIQREQVRGNYFMRELRALAAMPNPHLVKRLGESGATLVHAHFAVDATDAWPSVRAAGLPLVVTLHGYDINVHRQWWEAGHGGIRRRVYPSRLLTMAADPAVSFIAVSHAIKRRAVEYGIPAQKISVKYIGVDVERFQPGGLPLVQRRKRILFVGRMVEKKAPLLMVRIFAELRRQVPEAELVMIGDGPLLDEAKRLAGELGAPVVFLGARRSDEVLAQMHEARTFCLPSVVAENGDAEGLPLVLLEAQASGVPVVTSARGGAHEGLLDGKTGVACKEGAVPEFVHALRNLLSDDVLAARASAEARHYASSVFDIRKCSRELGLLYDRLAARTRRQ